MALRKVLDITLDGKEYQVAKNGGPYVLTRRSGTDPYGVDYHVTVPAEKLCAAEVEDLLDLLGATAEDLFRVKAAVGRGGGE